MQSKHISNINDTDRLDTLDTQNESNAKTNQKKEKQKMLPLKNNGWFSNNKSKKWLEYSQLTSIDMTLNWLIKQVN